MARLCRTDTKRIDCGYNLSAEDGEYIYTDIVQQGDWSRVMYSAICTAAVLAEKNGLGFEGWRYDTESDEPQFKAGEEIPLTERATDLYAVWEENAVTAAPYIKVTDIYGGAYRKRRRQ